MKFSKSVDDFGHEIKPSMAKSVFALFLTPVVIDLYRFSNIQIDRAMTIGTEKIFLGKGTAGHMYKAFCPADKKWPSSTSLNAYRTPSDMKVEGKYSQASTERGCCFDMENQSQILRDCAATLILYSPLHDRCIVPGDI
ncbi:hypothetical protein MLD38_038720 [Melastoma candidum]|uniref:Uncharacterized protein n=1 Tax=Melastoma candidum TaxID=119954 RepID=A0ACB9KZS6_9MYRT|nr:hypothetical protein MLD38_038720 [Melastoma candidum]